MGVFIGLSVFLERVQLVAVAPLQCRYALANDTGTIYRGNQPALITPHAATLVKSHLHQAISPIKFSSG